MKASEAKELADNYTEPLKKVLQWIAHRASEGSRFTFAKISEDSAIALKEMGYEVVKKENDYLIQW
jgi:hypothetical protein